MNIQQVVQSRPSVNGFGRRRGDRDIEPRNESKTQSGRFSSINAGSINGIKCGGFRSPTHDRVTYIMTHLIGHRVDVQVKNGSIISGIFHGTNADKEFEIVLKMAQVIKDGSAKGQKPVFVTSKKPQTMIIPSREFVQVIAKDVVLSNDETVSGHSHDMRKDLMLDSVISHSRNAEVERELEPWIPDEDDPECPELENIFDKTWNRNWDQFETNKSLFGVKSTFNEELYTTKLERGPMMREIEREASRIAREIECEETRDSHLAEERGVFFHDDFDLDEESRYSAVRRKDVGESRPTENTPVDDHNFEMLVLTDNAMSKSYSDVLSQIPKDESQTLSTSSSLEDGTSLGFLADKDEQLSASVDLYKDIAKSSLSVCEDSRLDEKVIDCSDEKSFLDEDSDMTAFQESQALKLDDKHLAKNLKESSPVGPAYDSSSSGEGKKCNETSVSSKSAGFDDHVNPSARPGSSVSSTSDRAISTSGLGGPSLSPTSIGSLSSEKSTLNPNAKEFKLNPNAKSFTPSASLRPHVAVSEGAIYYGNDITVGPQMHGLPVGMMGPTYNNPHVVYNPQMQSGQAYNMYGQQQMVIGQSRSVYYMPTYQSEERPYKGRTF